VIRSPNQNSSNPLAVNAVDTVLCSVLEVFLFIDPGLYSIVLHSSCGSYRCILFTITQFQLSSDLTRFLDCFISLPLATTKTYSFVVLFTVYGRMALV